MGILLPQIEKDDRLATRIANRRFDHSRILWIIRHEHSQYRTRQAISNIGNSERWTPSTHIVDGGNSHADEGYRATKGGSLRLRDQADDPGQSHQSSRKQTQPEIKLLPHPMGKTAQESKACAEAR